ncbi:MarR family winged helix-turn-helix transcriptional regulator [Thermomonospora cellulosilytica]|uniref:DNA-binding MarR family transcriptional regulator n=1 Tax=Thermomonospora cellulosilytica TaxID=1411118 RepID=A0A7W3MW71_9ACTN|nr:MarR family winged helix-turn-helix transcriptional regulator [Thermomonospora cellulosilytica]MBA9002959.1 DNA-binding MarR family transcriptional regulator [Thermomonospora cellulosilytica]
MPEPDERLYFLLQRAAHQLRLAADRRCLAAAGITTAQLGALFAVHDHPGITQQQLARTLGLRESAVTSLVTRLAAADLVTRRPHPNEHRATALHLTDHGVAALDAARPEIDRFNAELRARLGDTTFTQTAAALSKLTHDASESTPGP